ncbi:hypothetical protein TNCV_4099591 [Trichonephila clavipes]|nr:hypothetical protein TNCV_4099591 [Trichonephila clavipes]
MLTEKKRQGCLDEGNERVKVSSVTENIRDPLQTKVLDLKPKYVLGVSQALDPLEFLSHFAVRGLRGWCSTPQCNSAEWPDNSEKLGFEIHA